MTSLLNEREKKMPGINSLLNLKWLFSIISPASERDLWTGHQIYLSQKKLWAFFEASAALPTSFNILYVLLLLSYFFLNVHYTTFRNVHNFYKSFHKTFINSLLFWRDEDGVILVFLAFIWYPLSFIWKTTSNQKTHENEVRVIHTEEGFLQIVNLSVWITSSLS